MDILLDLVCKSYSVKEFLFLTIKKKKVKFY